MGIAVAFDPGSFLLVTCCYQEPPSTRSCDKLNRNLEPKWKSWLRLTQSRRSSRMERAHGRLLAGVLIAAGVLVAQTTSTEILGTVTDPSGALVPGAKVTLLRLATGERREMSTTSTGDYSFPLIEVGEYVITVTKEGFRTQ